MSDNKGLIDLHAHSLLSDGTLMPSELVRRYEVAGFRAVVIADHADSSNIDIIVTSLAKVCNELNKYWKIKAVPGVELTHLPLQQFSELIKYARENGAKVIVGHGESPVEPVIKGTNRAAIEAGVDVLAHPGNILKEDAELAAKKGTLLEITTRRGHSKTNSHVAQVAKSVSAKLVINSDSHTPEDIPNELLINSVAQQAHLTAADIAIAHSNAENLLKRIINLT
ncbi:MAG: histidinol phosphate phosphatase domain-containing protein [Candidatus Omnitrophota bacterium]